MKEIKAETAEVTDVSLDLSKIKTEWDLEGLFGYRDYNDPQIAKDVDKGIKVIKTFAKKWSNRKDWLNKPEILKQALDEYEKPTAAEPVLYYLFLKGDLDKANVEIQGLESKFNEALSKASEETIFFTLKLGKVSTETQKTFLKSSDLKKYHYFLKQLFNQAKHNLSIEQERILSRTSNVRTEIWDNALSKALSQKTIEYKGKTLTLTEARNIISSSTNQKERIHLTELSNQKSEELSELGEVYANSVAKNNIINMELRGYKQPFESRLKRHDISSKEFQELINTVTDNNQISRDFYQITKEILGLEKLTYADRSASIGKVSQKFEFKAACQTFYDVLLKFDSNIAAKFTNYLKLGRIDAFPKKGKAGGAYQVGTEDSKIGNFILLNNTGSFGDFMTLAHEFGHAIHSEYTTANQPNIYKGYTTSTAETASTFFENVAFYGLLPTLSQKDQLVALHDRISSLIATIFRQVAATKYELDFHKLVKDSGYVSHDQFKSLMNQSVSDYLGKTVELQDSDGIFYIGWTSSHFSRPFYVYSYAYGALMSQALYNNYLANPEKGKAAVIKFMSAGSSDSPTNIFRSAGLAVGPMLWQSGLDQIKADLKKMKALHHKLGQ